MMRWQTLGRIAATFLLFGAALACAAGGGEAGQGATVPKTAAKAEADAAAWGRVLEQHHRDGGLNYAAIASDRKDLDAYLAYLTQASLAELEGRPQAEQIAFWTNAYNAVVVHHVLAHYPDLESVRDVGSFFDGKEFPVAGSELTLDEIETKARSFGDPRVHFAVVCASTSCPDLRGEPYRGADLESQLADQTATFLADESKGLRYDPEENELWLSSIFKWYDGDFSDDPKAWVFEHLPQARAAEIPKDADVEYMDYDWSLNDRP